jgi:hypothetical protein
LSAEVVGACVYEDAGRYWFSTQPTLNRLADERASSQPPHKVEEYIVRVLQREASQKVGFSKIFAAPR